MKSPFVWGKGGRAMTPEDVERERELVALARAKMGDTSPVGHWTQGATRVVDALGAVLREKRTNKAEEAGLASADEAIAALLAGRGGAGGGVYASTSGGGSPSGTWTPDATPGPVAQATQGVTGGLSFPGQPAADTGVAQGGLGFGAAVMTPQEMLIEGAKRRGLDPIDVATAISYETGGKFDPTIKGPTTQWGTHEGLIQFGDPQGEKYGVDFSSPEAAWRTQLDPTSGGVWGYLEDTGVKPGMGLPEIYSAINAGAVGRMGASDANNGGAPGTVADKVAGMGAHRDKAAAFLGGTWTPNPDAGGGAVTMSTSGPSGGYGGGGTGGVDIASLLALQKNPWVAQKYGGVVDALMGQQFSRENAMWEAQQRQNDPMYQAQLAELTAPKVSDYDARAAAAAQYGLQPGTPEYQRFVLAGDVAVPGGADPFAGTKEIGGVLYGPDGQGGFVPLITPPAEPGYAVMAPEEVAALGLPPGSYQRGPKGEIKEVGGGGVNVSVSNGASEVGTIPQGYELFTDPNTGARSLRPIAGGPEDRTAKDAATAANKQTATDVITGAASAARLAADERVVGGWLGAVAAINPGSQNAEVYRQVEVLKANASAENIAAMRAASPTGAALGGVSDKDLALLASKSGALDPASPNFKRDLDDYERTVLRLVHGVDAGDRIFEATRAAPDASAPGSDGWTVLPNGVKVRVKP